MNLNPLPFVIGAVIAGATYAAGCSTETIVGSVAAWFSLVVVLSLLD